MSVPILRIGTRESQLALWQAAQVQSLLKANGFNSELVPIRSEGDSDVFTPLYAWGVQGVFTRALDAALLQEQIHLAVHSMKDVPVVPARGIAQAAVLKRASVKDILVFNKDAAFLDNKESMACIATSSIRRKAQWLRRYPGHRIENLRGNVNTRLKKLQTQNWDGAIFAAAGLERIGLRPERSVDLDWMLPAPAQGAIMVVARENDASTMEACHPLNDADTELCTRLERDFLKTLLGGCALPISALAIKKEDLIEFAGNIVSPDGKQVAEIKRKFRLDEARDAGMLAGREILRLGGQAIMDNFKNQAE